MPGGQHPLELIHARNLITVLSTPAFLIDSAGALAFYNEAASTLLGRHFEEVGPMSADEWGTAFEATDADGKPIAPADMPLSIALREGKPALGRFMIRALDGERHEIQVSAIPIVTSTATHGAFALFWPAGEQPG